MPSFLPALSSSTCIISLANQYNTSVDAAKVQRELLPGGMSKSERAVLNKCCDHVSGSAVFMVGWENR